MQGWVGSCNGWGWGESFSDGVRWVLQWWSGVVGLGHAVAGWVKGGGVGWSESCRGGVEWVGVMQGWVKVGLGGLCRVG